MKNHFGEFDPKVLEILKEAYNPDANSFAESCDDTFDFKTCRRSNGTTYGVPSSSDCAQKGAKEVRKSAQPAITGVGSDYLKDFVAQGGTVTAVSKNWAASNAKLDEGREYAKAGDVAAPQGLVIKNGSFSAKAMNSWDAAANSFKEGMDYASAMYNATSNPEAKKTASSLHELNKKGAMAAYKAKIKHGEDQLAAMERHKANANASKSSSGSTRRQRVGAALRGFGQDMQRQTQEQLDQYNRDNKRYSIKKDGFGGYTIGEDAFGNIRQRDQFGL